MKTWILYIFGGMRFADSLRCDCKTENRVRNNKIVLDLQLHAFFFYMANVRGR